MSPPLTITTLLTQMCVNYDLTQCLEAAPTTEFYTLSLHDALPICGRRLGHHIGARHTRPGDRPGGGRAAAGHLGYAAASQPHGSDRKSTRLNSSHVSISYAVFCLKKKTKIKETDKERRYLL